MTPDGYDFKQAKNYETFEVHPCRNDYGWDVIGLPGWAELAHEDRRKDAEKVRTFFEAYKEAQA